MNESIGRVRVLLDSLHGNIREVLTADQVERFEDALRTHRTFRIRRQLMLGDSISQIDTTISVQDATE